MTYDEALAYIDGLLTGQRPTMPPGQKLDRMALLLTELGHPERGLPAVLVAGTKGKGSTSTMLAAVLAAAGRRVGLYTKPHISDYRERIQVDGEPVTPQALAALVAQVAPAVERASGGPGGRPTYFEVSVALALQHFATSQVDVAVVEVGIGGRYDAANLLDPVLSVITPISRDHTDLLGDTIDAIARQKAGIMRRGRPVVSASQPAEADAALADESAAAGALLVRVEETAAVTGSRPGRAGHVIHLRTTQTNYGRLVIGLRGRHQATNAATAVVAAEILLAPARIPVKALAAGLRDAVLPGRFELVGGTPPVVLDVAHNAASMTALCDALDDYFPGRPLVLVFGMIATHDAVEPTALIAGRARVAVVTEPAHVHPVPADVLAAEVRKHLDAVEVFPDRAAAVARARALASPADVVCVTGSVYLVGDVRGRLLAAQPAEVSRRRSGAAARR